MTVDNRYVAGPGLLLGNGSRWLLVENVPDEQVDELWACVTGRRPVVDAVRDFLARHPEADPPALALVDLTDGGERVLTRGSGEVDRRGDVHRLSVGPQTGGRSLPFSGGIVAASYAEVHPSPVRTMSGARSAAPVAGMIDGVPPEILASSAPPPTAETGSTVVRPTPRRASPDDADHDGRTLQRHVDHLHQSTHETVLATRCPAGHLSPPYSAHCRVCGDAVPPQEPQRVARPSLGRLRLPTGEQVQLDRGVVLGRRPAPLPEGEEWPHLVELPTDSTYLSRLHLEIRLDGWLVMARDLGSQGGTTLKVPGRPAERIRAHESYILEPGHALDLADAYEVVVEGEPA